MIIATSQGRSHVLSMSHTHRGLMETTVAEEKKYNPRLTKPVGEFVDIMNNLNLPYPKQIGEFFY